MTIKHALVLIVADNTDSRLAADFLFNPLLPGASSGCAIRQRPGLN